MLITPEDIVEMAPHVLASRIMLTNRKKNGKVFTEDDRIENIIKALE